MLLLQVGFSSICAGEPTWFLFLLLFLPLAIYLFWRPISLAMAGARTGGAHRVPAAAAAPGRKPRPPSVVRAAKNGKNAKRYRFSIKAADNYLWDMGGGGARPLAVDFQTASNNALPPSAPKKEATAANRRKRSVFAWEVPSEFDYVYQEDEIQPGDIDFEFTLLILRCCPCLRPRKQGEPCCPCLPCLPC